MPEEEDATMKTLHAPGTADAMIDAIHAAAQNHPLAIWIVGVALTAAFASWASRWI